jgi:hypothetical protein
MPICPLRDGHTAHAAEHRTCRADVGWQGLKSNGAWTVHCAHPRLLVASSNVNSAHSVTKIDKNFKCNRINSLPRGKPEFLETLCVAAHQRVPLAYVSDVPIKLANKSFY